MAERLGIRTVRKLDTILDSNAYQWSAGGVDDITRTGSDSLTAELHLHRRRVHEDVPVELFNIVLDGDTHINLQPTDNEFCRFDGNNESVLLHRAQFRIRRAYEVFSFDRQHENPD